MTYVPADAASVLPQETPKAGGTGKIDAAAAYAQEVVGDAKQYQVSLRSAQKEFVGLKSQGVQKINTQLSGGLIPGAQTLQRSASAAKKAFNAYAAEVDRINTAADAVVSSMNTALGTIRSSASSISSISRSIRWSQAYAWDTAPPGRMPDPTLDSRGEKMTPAETAAAEQNLRWIYEQQWLAAAVAWNTALTAISTGKGDWSTLIGDRKSAEARLVQGLNDTEIGALISVSGGGGGGKGPMVGAALVRGGGSIVSSAKTNVALKKLLDSKLSPEEMAKAWKELGLSKDDIAKLPLEQLVALAKLPGLPAWAQDKASREMLDRAEKDPKSVYDAMGFDTYPIPAGKEFVMGGYTLDEFKKQVAELKTSLVDAKRIADDLGKGIKVQLLGFGNHSNAMTAGISLGDLDKASNVAVNVPGMFSNVSGMGDMLKASKTLFSSAQKENKNLGYAVVAWIGYHSPDAGEVRFGDRAAKGGEELAKFLSGISWSRATNGKSMTQFVLYGHSYGSTTGAEALKMLKTQKQPTVSAFVTYGSAGLEPDTTVDSLGTKVYSTHAKGDKLAGGGSFAGPRVDPRKMPQVKEFSSEGNGKSQDRVTVHDMFTEGKPWGFFNWGGKVGYLSHNTSSAKDMGKIFANGGL